MKVRQFYVQNLFSYFNGLYIRTDVSWLIESDEPNKIPLKFVDRQIMFLVAFLAVTINRLHDYLGPKRFDYDRRGISSSYEDVKGVRKYRIAGIDINAWSKKPQEKPKERMSSAKKV